MSQPWFTVFPSILATPPTLLSSPIATGAVDSRRGGDGTNGTRNDVGPTVGMDIFGSRKLAQQKVREAERRVDSGRKGRKSGCDEQGAKTGGEKCTCDGSTAEGNLGKDWHVARLGPTKMERKLTLR